nr:MAG TPA: hypothetical protein [Bacteriophage sp.]
MKTRLDRMKIEGTILDILSCVSIVALIFSPFLLLLVVKEPPECQVKTTERGNRLHITLDCPMIPASALEASNDEK